MRVPPNEFMESVLQIVKKTVRFDSAVWATGGLLGDMTVAHSMYLHNQSEEMMVNYAKYVNQDDLLGQIICTPGITFGVYDAIPREQYIELDVYKDHCQVFGIEDAISTAILEPTSRIFSFISFYRSDYSDPFSSDDRALKQDLSAHLVQAKKINQQIYTRAQVVSSQKGGFVAQCSKEGILLFAESRFIEILEKEWPDWEGAMLPMEVVAQLSAEHFAIYEGRHVIVECEAADFGFNLLGRKRQIVDRMTSREREIAEQLRLGSSYKEISRRFGISSSTVTNHVNSIYRKLYVQNKAQLSALLSNSDE